MNNQNTKKINNNKKVPSLSLSIIVGTISFFALKIELDALLNWIPEIYNCRKIYGAVAESGPCSTPAMFMFILSPVAIALSVAAILIFFSVLKSYKKATLKANISFYIIAILSVLSIISLVIDAIAFILAVTQ